MPRRSIRSSTVASTRSVRSTGAGDAVVEDSPSKRGRSRGRTAKYTEEDMEIEESNSEEIPAKKRRGKQPAPEPSPQKRLTRGAMQEQDDDSSRSRSRTRKEKESPVGPSSRSRRSLASKKEEKEESEESDEEEVLEEKEEKKATGKQQRGKKTPMKKSKEESKEMSPSPAKGRQKTPTSKENTSVPSGRGRRGAKAEEPTEEAAVTPRGRRGQKKDQPKSEDSQSVSESEEPSTPKGRNVRGRKSEPVQEEKEEIVSPRSRGKKTKVEPVKMESPDEKISSPKGMKRGAKKVEEVKDEEEEEVVEKTPPPSRKARERKSDASKATIAKSPEEALPSKGRRKRESGSSENKSPEPPKSRSRRSKEVDVAEPSPKRGRSRRSAETTKEVKSVSEEQDSNVEETTSQSLGEENTTEEKLGVKTDDPVDKKEESPKVEADDNFETSKNLEEKANDEVNMSEEKANEENISLETDELEGKDEKIEDKEDSSAEQEMESDEHDELPEESPIVEESTIVRSEETDKPESDRGADRIITADELKNVEETNEKSVTEKEVEDIEAVPTSDNEAEDMVETIEDETADTTKNMLVEPSDSAKNLECTESSVKPVDAEESCQKTDSKATENPESYQQLQTEEISDEEMETGEEQLEVKQTVVSKEVNPEKMQDIEEVSVEENSEGIDEPVKQTEAVEDVSVEEGSLQEAPEQLSSESQESYREVMGLSDESNQITSAGIETACVHKESVKQTAEVVEDISAEEESLPEAPDQVSSESRESFSVSSGIAVEQVTACVSETQKKLDVVEDISAGEDSLQEIAEHVSSESQFSNQEVMGVSGDSESNLVSECVEEPQKQTETVEDISAEDSLEDVVEQVSSESQLSYTEAKDDSEPIIDSSLKPLSSATEKQCLEANVGQPSLSPEFQEISDDDDMVPDTTCAEQVGTSTLSPQTLHSQSNNKIPASVPLPNVSDTNDVEEGSSLVSPSRKRKHNEVEVDDEYSIERIEDEDEVPYKKLRVEPAESQPNGDVHVSQHETMEVQNVVSTEGENEQVENDRVSEILKDYVIIEDSEVPPANSSEVNESVPKIATPVSASSDSVQDVSPPEQTISHCVTPTVDQMDTTTSEKTIHSITVPTDCETPIPSQTQDFIQPCTDIVSESSQSSLPQTVKNVSKDVLFSRKVVSNPSYSGAEDKFSVVSYNVLAECHLRKSDYNYTPEEFLTTDYRHSLLMEELKYLDADILCLQEVGETYHSCIDKEMNALGYIGLYKKRTLEYYQEGDCTYYKTSRFSLVEQETYSLTELISKDVDEHGLGEDLSKAVKEYIQRADVLVVSKLQCKNTGKILTVGNTHIVFGFKKIPDVQCMQISAVIKKVVSTAGGEQNPHIICGDFNSEVIDPGYQLISEGYLSDETIQKLQSLQSVELPDGTKTSLINHLWEAFQHTSSNLKSSYKEVLGEEPGISTFTSFMCCAVDYIFYNSGCLDVASVLQTVDKGTILSTKGLPNSVFPSDHVSLKTVFSFK